MALRNNRPPGMDELVLGVGQSPVSPAKTVAHPTPVRSQKRPPRPVPQQPAPLLPNCSPLRYEAPQRERAAAILAAPAPLIAAAQPLLDVLENMPQALDADQIAAFHHALERQVANFQSVCVEARIRVETIIMGSYVLCAAIDEASGLTPWGGATGQEVGAWANRRLAAQFHGDTDGGVKVFELLANLYPFIPRSPEPAPLIDLIELIGLIFGLGFEGVCRSSSQGMRTLEDIRYKLDATVHKARNEAADTVALALRERTGQLARKPPHIPYSFPNWVKPTTGLIVHMGPGVLILVTVGWIVWRVVVSS